MTLKSIDAQLSLTRSLEASAVQNQLNHKPMDDQAAAAGLLRKQAEEQRKRSNQVDKADDARIRDGSGRNGQYYSRSKKKQDKDNKTEEAGEHPYKGKFIDLSL